MPRKKIGKTNRFLYCLSGILKWLRTAGPWRSRGVDADDVESGSDSPGLERLRQAKAAIAELDLALRRTELLDRDKVRQSLLRFAMLIRRAGERVGVRYGPDALAIVNESLEECEAVINVELCGRTSDADDTR
jgi:hypothetical protein